MYSYNITVRCLWLLYINKLIVKLTKYYYTIDAFLYKILSFQIKCPIWTSHTEHNIWFRYHHSPLHSWMCNQCTIVLFKSRVQFITNRNNICKTKVVIAVDEATAFIECSMWLQSYIKWHANEMWIKCIGLRLMIKRHGIRLKTVSIWKN